jgi:asparaginyl-tRNA synthetase
MKNRSDKKTVAAFDLLFPFVGELVGGSVREGNIKTLQVKAHQTQINIEELD